jgi:hypothetical protein
MDELHIKLIDQQNFEPKEGQCDDLMCSNKRSITHCPSLDYKYVASLGPEVDRAFDLLFEEVMKLNKN